MEFFHVIKDERAVVLEFESPVKYVSSAFYSDGVGEVKWVANIRVEKGWSHDDPWGYIEERLHELGLEPEDTLAFLTAADVEQAAMVQKGDVFAIATAGFGNAYCSKTKEHDLGGPGTVNVVVVVGRPLTTRSLVEALTWAVEAKCHGVLRIVLGNEGPCLGTTTDSVAVLCPQGDELDSFCGPATELGRRLMSAVEEAVVTAGERTGYSPTRSIKTILEEEGIELDDLVEAGRELFVGEWEEEYASRVLEELERGLENPNVALAVFTALLVDRFVKLGSYPKECGGLQEDPGWIYFDEVLGQFVAMELGGYGALFNFKRYDEEKPGILKEVDERWVMLDDVLAGLIAGAMTVAFRPG
ncbi:multifunctional adenosylcobinamide hydrolase CbiS [Methanopyrus sp.]